MRREIQKIYNEKGCWFFVFEEKLKGGGTKRVFRRKVSSTLKGAEDFFAELKEEEKIEAADFDELPLIMEEINTKYGRAILAERFKDGK